MGTGHTCQEAGRKLFLGRCAGSHTIRVTEAFDLTHLKSRSMLAAGGLINATEHLVEWIIHFLELKPGRGCSSTVGSMTDVIEDSTQYLHKDDLNAIAHYLKTLHPHGKKSAFKPDTPALDRELAAIVTGKWSFRVQDSSSHSQRSAIK